MVDTYVDDLFALYRIGRTDIMEMSQTYSGLSSGLEGTRSGTLVQMHTQQSTRAVPKFRSAKALAQARNDLQYAFAHSSESTQACGLSLMEVAEAYSHDEDEIQSDFEAKQNELFGDDPVPVSKPTYPDPSDSPKIANE